MDNNNNKTTMCNGNCQACSFQQRAYCATFVSRKNLGILLDVVSSVEALRTEVSELKEHIKTMQACNVEMLNPFERAEESLKFENESTIGASGADENRLPKQSNHFSND